MNKNNNKKFQDKQFPTTDKIGMLKLMTGNCDCLDLAINSLLFQAQPESFE